MNLPPGPGCNPAARLNEVRPGRPEQWDIIVSCAIVHPYGLNEVRPGRPEQSVEVADVEFHGGHVSMKSGLEDRNNQYIEGTSGSWGDNVSMKSGLEDRNNAGTYASCTFLTDGSQ